MKDRKETILRYAEPLFSKQFLKSSEQTAQFCEEHSKETVRPFLVAFWAVIDQVAERQDNKELDKVQYIQFSHLYSSIFLKRHLIRIDVMDLGFYNDTSPAVSYWDAQSLYRLFEPDIEEIKKVVEASVLRIREYEVDFIRYAYAPYYHRLAKAFIQMMLEGMMSERKGIGAERSFLPEAIRQENKVRILLGEYMGETDLLFTLNIEREGKSDAVF